MADAIPITSSDARRAGVFWMLVSAVAFSTAGLFTKGVTADAWAVIFWRGAFAAVAIAFFMSWRGVLVQEVRRMGWPGWAAAIIGVTGTAAFLNAFKLTTIANVTLIYATSPFLAAAIAWLWFGERPRRAIVTASLAALVGVGVIVAGSFGGTHLRGDLLALWMTFVMALWIVIFRRYPQTPAAAPTVLSSLLLLPVALVAGDPLAAPVSEIPIMAAFGLVFAVAAVAMTEAARRLPASEAALLSALETPLAPILAFLLLSEVPTSAAILGGSIILAAIFGSQLAYRGRGRA